jgi:hypothetical protein
MCEVVFLAKDMYQVWCYVHDKKFYSVQDIFDW